MTYIRYRSNWRSDALGGPTQFGDFFNSVEDGLVDHEGRLSTIELSAGGVSGLSVIIYSSGAYPTRPSVPAGHVRYVGPVQPSTWLTNDEWIDNS